MTHVNIPQAELTDVVKRLKRIQGQVGGIIRMIEDGRDCAAVVTQLGRRFEGAQSRRFRRRVHRDAPLLDRGGRRDARGRPARSSNACSCPWRDGLVVETTARIDERRIPDDPDPARRRSHPRPDRRRPRARRGRTRQHRRQHQHPAARRSPARLVELDLAIPIVTVCQSGGRSQRAAEALQAAGYTVANLDGGIDRWTSEGRTTVWTPLHFRP